MIHRDKEGNIIGADKLSDLSKAMTEIEKDLKKAQKIGIPNYSAEEKEALIAKVNDLKVLLSFAQEEIKKSTNPMEVIGFVKQIFKLKGVAEEIQKYAEEYNDGKDIV